MFLRFDEGVLAKMLMCIFTAFSKTIEWAFLFAVFAAGTALLSPCVAGWLTEAVLGVGIELGNARRALIGLFSIGASASFCLACMVFFFTPPNKHDRWIAPCLYLGALLWFGTPALVGYTWGSSIAGIMLALIVAPGVYGFATAQLEAPEKFLVRGKISQ